MEHEEKLEKIETFVNVTETLIDETLTCMSEESRNEIKDNLHSDLKKCNVDINDFKNFLNEREILDIADFDGSLEYYFGHYDAVNMLHVLMDINEAVLSHRVEHLMGDVIEREKEMDRQLSPEEQMALYSYINTRYMPSMEEEEVTVVSVGNPMITHIMDDEILNFENKEEFEEAMDKFFEFIKLKDIAEDIQKFNNTKEETETNDPDKEEED